jgi:hypothetical protein
MTWRLFLGRRWARDGAGAVTQARADADAKGARGALAHLAAVCKALDAASWLSAAGRGEGGGGLVVQLVVVLVEMARAAVPGGALADGALLSQVLSLLDWAASSAGEACQPVSHLVLEVCVRAPVRRPCNGHASVGRYKPPAVGGSTARVRCHVNGPRAADTGAKGI